MTTPTIWPEHFWRKSPPPSWKIAIFVNLSNALSYGNPRLFGQTSIFGGAVRSICYPYLHYHYKSSFLSIVSMVQNRKKRKPPFTLILYWADFSFVGVFSFFCQDLGKIYWQNVAFAGEEKLLEMMLYIYTVKAEPSWKALYLLE